MSLYFFIFFFLAACLAEFFLSFLKVTRVVCSVFYVRSCLVAAADFYNTMGSRVASAVVYSQSVVREP